jgi:hypothetical protein
MEFLSLYILHWDTMSPYIHTEILENKRANKNNTLEYTQTSE